MTVLGVLGLIAGLAAAGWGVYDQSENHRQLFQDRDREQSDQAAMIAGAVTAALGLILFLAGLITLLASRSKPVVVVANAPAPATEAAGAKPAAPRRTTTAPEPMDRDRRNAVVAGTIAVVLVALLLAGLFMAGTGGGGNFFHGSADPSPHTVMDEWHNGTVQTGAAGLPGVPPVDLGSDAAGDFATPKDAASCTLTLDWTKPSGGGADKLHLLVARDGQTVAEDTQGPGFSLPLQGAGVAAAQYHFTVSSGDGAGVVSQPFQLHVTCIS